MCIYSSLTFGASLIKDVHHSCLMLVNNNKNVYNSVMFTDVYVVVAKRV